MKHIIKKLKPLIIENYVYEGFYLKSMPVIDLPYPYTLRIFDNDKTTGINIIDRHKTPQNICFVAFINDAPAHISWVFKKKLLLKQLGYSYHYYTVGSFTYSEHQGKGIYPAILNSIVKYCNNKKILGFVNIENQASIKAFQKAGFIKSYRFKLIRVLGIKIYLKKYAD